MKLSALVLAAAASFSATALSAQTFTTDDPVLRAIWNEGMVSSHAYTLAQALLDSVGRA